MKNLKTFEEFSQEFDTNNIQNSEETNEGLFSTKNSRKQDLEQEYVTLSKAWSQKGIRKLTQEEYNVEMKKAELDSYEGKWGNDGKVMLYRPQNKINWAKPGGHTFGGGANH